MDQKARNAWTAIEEGLGRCCLYKKAAYNELAGKESRQLTLASMAEPEQIRVFLKGRKCEENGTRYTFVQDGVRVDLTTYHGINDNDTLCNAMFRHTLTVDSIGLSSEGKVCDRFGGMRDIKSKTVTLIAQDAAISETLFGRILRLVWEQGYSLDAGVKKRIADDKMLEKMGYRKKFCEMLALAMEGDTVNWKNIARLVSVAEPVLPPKSKIVASTAALDDTAPDAPARRDFMWVIFSLVGAPGKDLTGVLAKEPMRNFYDALRTNLQAKLADYAVYRRLKNSYGAEFLELLMDVKEKWMQLEGLQYKRVTESDFDFMTAFISDADYWTDVKEAELNPAAPKAEQNAEDTQVPSAVETKLNIDISKVNASNWLTEHYNSEDYEEIDEAEGSIADTYIPEDDDNITHNPFAGSEEELDDEPVQKKEVCIDDEQPEDSGFSGLNVNEIVSYEKELAEMSEVQPEHDDIVNHTRGHKSALLGGGE